MKSGTQSLPSKRIATGIFLSALRSNPELAFLLTPLIERAESPLTLLVAGPPGAGKSTLINSLIWAETGSTAPDSLAPTSLIGGTTEATLYRARSTQGLGLIDTPGNFIYSSEDERKKLLQGLPTPDALIYVTTNDIGDDDVDALNTLGFNPATTVVTTNRSDEFDGGYASPEDAIALANTKANDIRSQSAECFDVIATYALAAEAKQKIAKEQITTPDLNALAGRYAKIKAPSTEPDVISMWLDAVSGIPRLQALIHQKLPFMADLVLTSESLDNIKASAFLAASPRLLLDSLVPPDQLSGLCVALVGHLDKLRKNSLFSEAAPLIRVLRQVPVSETSKLGNAQRNQFQNYLRDINRRLCGFEPPEVEGALSTLSGLYRYLIHQCDVSK